MRLKLNNQALLDFRQYKTVTIRKGLLDEVYYFGRTWMLAEIGAVD